MIGDGIERPYGFCSRALLPAVERRLEQLRAAAEVPVEAPFCYSESFGQRADSQRTEPFLGNQLQRGFCPIGRGQGWCAKARSACTFLGHAMIVSPYPMVLTARAPYHRVW